MKYAALTLLLATPAAADCLTSANLATDTAFQRKDRRPGPAKAEGQNLRIHHSINADDRTDTRMTKMGIHDLWANFHFDPVPVVGGGYPHREWTGSARLAEPTPGKRMTAKTIHKRSADIGAEFATVTTHQANYSGWTHKIIALKAAYSDGTTQRHLTFPDLGMGLETRTRGFERQNGERRGPADLRKAP